MKALVEQAWLSDFNSWNLYKYGWTGVGEMAQWLETLAALQKGPDFIPSTQMMA